MPEFDALLIPGGLREFVADIAQRMQCPVEYPAVAVLTSLGSLIGKEICIKPKRNDTWMVCPNLWGAIVGDPGSMKSPAIAAAIQFLKAIEKRLDAEFETGSARTCCRRRRSRG